MDKHPPPFTESELAYLGTQRLGRLASAAARGALQNNPVGFVVNEALGTVDIHGRDLGATAKFHNVARNPAVALVVDDLASIQPWVVRGVEIRGRAQGLEDEEPPSEFLSREVIRIWPDRILSWGLEAAIRPAPGSGPRAA